MDTALSRIQFRSVDGNTNTLSDFHGKVVLIVNVASKCGLTPQYEGLEKIYEKYKQNGLVVMGFPANEFAGQEPGTNDEIQAFCRGTFGVQFPVFEKVVVKGEGQHPLFKHLTSVKPNSTRKPDGVLEAKLKEKGLLNGQPNDITWNFEKFLVGRSGKVVGRFAPDISPEDPTLLRAIETELAQPV